MIPLFLFTQRTTIDTNDAATTRTKRTDGIEAAMEIGNDVSNWYVGVVMGVTGVGVVIGVTGVGVVCGPSTEVLGQDMISDALQKLY